MPSDAELQDSYEFQEWRDLIASARILDLAASANGLADPDDRKAAAILAACAFGMSGTSVSAIAVIRGHRLLDSDLSTGELAALALSAPTLAREVFPKLPTGSSYRFCIENLVAYLVNADETLLNSAALSLEEATQQESSPWESSLLRLCRVSLAHTRRLATAKVLQEYTSRFPKGYLERLVDDSPMLLPSQYEAIK